MIASIASRAKRNRRSIWRPERKRIESRIGSQPDRTRAVQHPDVLVALRNTGDSDAATIGRDARISKPTVTSVTNQALSRPETIEPNQFSRAASTRPVSDRAIRCDRNETVLVR